MIPGAKTTREHWDAGYTRPIRLRLPSPLIVSTGNIQRLLRRHIRAGMKVLEIGFAPGKHLVWAGKVLGAGVAGLDYSEAGVAMARTLFERLGVAGDLICGDVFASPFAEGTFDFVYSLGLIEHFDDPVDIVRRHVLLARPGGGIVLLVIPNYGGPYGRLQAWLDTPNLALHNNDIMSPEVLSTLAPEDLCASATVERVGRLDPWLLSFGARLPAWAARSSWWAGNVLGLLQPFDVGPLCPWLALTLVRR